MVFVCQRIVLLLLGIKSELLKPEYLPFYSSALPLLGSIDRQNEILNACTVMSSFSYAEINHSDMTLSESIYCELGKMQALGRLSPFTINTLKALNIDLMADDTKNQALRLRKLVHEEYLNDFDTFSNFFRDDTEFSIFLQNYIEEEVTSPAFISSFPLALSRTLKVIVLVFSSLSLAPVIPVFPPTSENEDNYIALLLREDEYVIARYVNQTSDVIESAKETSESARSCRCGQGAKKEASDIKSCVKYSSRCPCKQSLSPCNDGCRCICCGNPLGSPDVGKRLSVPLKRKRRLHEGTTKAIYAPDFLARRGYGTIAGAWCILEKIIIAETLKKLKFNNANHDSNFIYSLFVEVAGHLTNKFGMLPCTLSRTSQDFDKQLDLICKKDELFKKLLLIQARANIYGCVYN